MGNKGRFASDVRVTSGNQRIADALIACYLEGWPPVMKLERMSEITRIPLSDLFGAIRRRAAAYGDVVDLEAVRNSKADRAVARAMDELVAAGKA